LIHEKLAVRW